LRKITCVKVLGGGGCGGENSLPRAAQKLARNVAVQNADNRANGVGILHKN